MAERSSRLFHPHLSICTAGFGTLHLQVAGLHRADPSTTLNKGRYEITAMFIAYCIITGKYALSTVFGHFVESG